MRHKTSIERSHSGFSNFVLTLATLPAAVCFPGFFALFAFENVIPNAALIPLAVVFAALSVLSAFLLCIFKR